MPEREEKCKGKKKRPDDQVLNTSGQHWRVGVGKNKKTVHGRGKRGQGEAERLTAANFSSGECEGPMG